jgi:AGCS family alanine or glycine:cation symporter
MTQGNSIASQLYNATGGVVQEWMTGIAITLFIGLTLLGGITRIGKVTEAMVPVMILFYIAGGALVLIANAGNVGPAFQQIFHDAFTGTAAVGGFTGSTLAMALRYGMARGIFSNESGMGSASIVAAAAKSSHPVRQGLVSMTQTFIDTLIVVTFTGLVIISSGHWFNNVSEDGSLDPGVFTQSAFHDTFLGSAGTWIVVVSLICFASSTIIGWSYYGERCAVSLLGIKIQAPYRIIFSVVAFFGCVIELTTVWTIADILNGLMAIPNLIGLVILSGLIARETKAYLSKDPTLELNNVQEFDLQQWTPGRGWRVLDRDTV